MTTNRYKDEAISLLHLQLDIISDITDVCYQSEGHKASVIHTLQTLLIRVLRIEDLRTKSIEPTKTIMRKEKSRFYSDKNLVEAYNIVIHVLESEKEYRHSQNIDKVLSELDEHITVVDLFKHD